MTIDSPRVDTSAHRWRAAKHGWVRYRVFAMLLTLLLYGCSAAQQQPTAFPTITAPPQPTITTTVLQPGALAETENCPLEPVVAPTLPAIIPGYAQLDPSTNLHITGQYRQTIDLADYRLKITGSVAHPLELTYDQLRCLPHQQVETVLICPGYFEDFAGWSGVPLRDLLGLVQPLEGAKTVTMRGADEYSTVMSLEEANLSDNLIAYQWEDEPLPILHGFPVRAVMPTMRGSRWVKWLLEISVE